MNFSVSSISGVSACLSVLLAVVAQAQVPRLWQLSRVHRSIGSADTPGPQLFGRIADAFQQRESGRIVAADGLAREVRLFTGDGEFLRSVGRFGAGPGEFRTLSAVRRCAGDSILIYDASLKRASLFAPSGDFVRAVDPGKWTKNDLPPTGIWCNDNGYFGAVHRSPDPPVSLGLRRPIVTLTVTTPLGRVVELGKFPSEERWFFGAEDMPRPLGKKTLIALGARSVYVGTGDTYDIIHLSIQGVTLGAIHVARAAVPVTRPQVDTYVTMTAERQSRRGGIQRKRIEMILREIDFPDSYPAYDMLLIDASDQLWVEDYPVPGADSVQWSIFSERGTEVGRLRVPTSFRILDVWSNHVLGVWRDADDVEFIRVYRLE